MHPERCLVSTVCLVAILSLNAAWGASAEETASASRTSESFIDEGLQALNSNHWNDAIAPLQQAYEKNKSAIIAYLLFIAYSHVSDQVNTKKYAEEAITDSPPLKEEYRMEVVSFMRAYVVADICKPRKKVTDATFTMSGDEKKSPNLFKAMKEKENAGEEEIEREKIMAIFGIKSDDVNKEVLARSDRASSDGIGEEKPVTLSSSSSGPSSGDQLVPSPKIPSSDELRTKDEVASATGVSTREIK